MRSFIRLSGARKKLVFQAIGASIYSFVLFAFFKRFSSFGQKTTIVKERSAFHQELKDITWAIHAVDRRIPWKNVCRHQAYQAKLLCDHYKIPCYIYIGFKKDDVKNEIQAHAWTIAGGKMITGFCNPSDYIIQSIYENKWA